MVVIIAPEQADGVTRSLEAAGETLFAIGQVEEGPRGCTVSGKAGSWGSAGNWSATHNA
jgi:phosphoribosylformylglycinamidine cyclo-ligase